MRSSTKQEVHNVLCYRQEEDQATAMGNMYWKFLKLKRCFGASRQSTSQLLPQVK